MSDLRAKIGKRVQEAPAKSVREVFTAEDRGVRKTTLYLPVEHVRELKKLAADEDTSMTALVQEGIAHVLRARGHQ